jgi:DNA invertase Pin-like site-specific DNA recombinase
LAKLSRVPSRGSSEQRAGRRLQRRQLGAPGLERLRDLAAEGQLEAVLVYSPDRLSRKYAYQILLTEEFARNGVETVFVKAPARRCPESSA